MTIAAKIILGVCASLMAMQVQAGQPQYFVELDSQSKATLFEMGCNTFIFYFRDGNPHFVNMPIGDASGNTQTGLGLEYVVGLADLQKFDPMSPAYEGNVLTHLVWINRPDPAQPEYERVYITVERSNFRRFLAENGESLAFIYGNRRSVDVAIIDDDPSSSQ